MKSSKSMCSQSKVLESLDWCATFVIAPVVSSSAISIRFSTFKLHWLFHITYYAWHMCNFSCSLYQLCFCCYCLSFWYCCSVICCCSRHKRKQKEPNKNHIKHPKTATVQQSFLLHPWILLFFFFSLFYQPVHVFLINDDLCSVAHRIS